MEEKYFKTCDEGLEWFETLPEEHRLFFFNLIKTLYLEQPMTNDPNKIEEIKQDCEKLFKQQLEKKNETIKLLENRAEDKKNEITNLEEKNKKLKEELDNYNEEANQKLEKRIQERDEKWRSKIAVEKQKFDTVNQELGFEKGKNVVLDEENKKMKTEFLDVMNNFVGKSASSAEKGKIGENWVFQLFHSDPSISIRNVTGNKNQGDFVITFKKSNINIMIDVKKYEKKIPKKEREKFLSDLERNDYDGGLLISLHAGFYEAVEELKVYKTDKMRKPFIYLGDVISMKNPNVVLKSIAYFLCAYAEDKKASIANENNIYNLILTQLAADKETWNQAKKACSHANAQLKLLETLEKHAKESYESMKVQNNVWKKFTENNHYHNMTILASQGVRYRSKNLPEMTINPTFFTDKSVNNFLK